MAQSEAAAAKARPRRHAQIVDIPYTHRHRQMTIEHIAHHHHRPSPYRTTSVSRNTASMRTPKRMLPAGNDITPEQYHQHAHPSPEEVSFPPDAQSSAALRIVSPKYQPHHGGVAVSSTSALEQCRSSACVTAAQVRPDLRISLLYRRRYFTPSAEY